MVKVSGLNEGEALPVSGGQGARTGAVFAGLDGRALGA